MYLLQKFLVASVFLGLANVAIADEVVIPDKITQADIAGEIFKHPSMIKTERENGTVTLDVLTNKSSDDKLETGMYQAGPGRFEVGGDGYGVDEFMYFIKGSVKLTSSDGSVQTINAGEAVSLPKEWTGIWETEGYTKIYVIYTSDVASE